MLLCSISSWNCTLNKFTLKVKVTVKINSLVIISVGRVIENFEFISDKVKLSDLKLLLNLTLLATKN
jgi:hypothetical protein